MLASISHDAIAVMDESAGRSAAEVEGIETQGTAYLVLSAVKRGAMAPERGRETIDAMVDASFEADGEGHPDALTFRSGDNVPSEDSPAELDTGNDIVVDITFDTRGIDPTDEIVDTITVHGEDPNRGDEL